jgi:hypothetical protein
MVKEVLKSAKEERHLAGLDQGQVFYSRSGRLHPAHFLFGAAKLPSLELNDRPKTTFWLSPIDYPTFLKKKFFFNLKKIF